ncbi:MAG TPA: amidohydrolase family protein, partial [Pilimelia sp.]|nr:amidohydrolase family protein [Pilimelia sp.]
VGLAFGSDAPVTPVDPWGAVAAAVGHHEVAQRLSVRAAFAAHTRGGWRALGPVADPGARAVREREGTLVPGAPATFAVWRVPGGLSGGLPRVGVGVPAPVCVRTVVRGVEVFAADG